MANSTQTLNPNQNQSQNQKQQGQKDQYSNQANTGLKNDENARKVGNNMEKDEPRANDTKDEK